MRLPWRQRADARGLEEPRADGVARTVEAVVPLTTSGAVRTAVPVEGQLRVGPVVHLVLHGPTLLRPGDGEDPHAEPLHRVGEAVVLLRGELEHRDALGHRGVLRAPAVLLHSGGAGVLREVGPSRAVRRDGGEHEVVVVRWIQPGPAVVPTTRTAPIGPARAQGRTRVSRWVGPDGAVAEPTDLAVVHLAVPAGGSADVAVPADGPAVLVVRSGTALVGDDLVEVAAGQAARLGGAGTRLSVATRLEGSGGADVVVVATPPSEAALVDRHGLVAAADDDALARALEVARTGGFGTLPALDG